MTGQVLSQRIDVKAETDVSCLCVDSSLELDQLIEHVERADNIERPQSIELLHHELPNDKLIDDALLFITFDDGTGDIEVHFQVVLVFQAGDKSRTFDVHQTVGTCHHHITEAQAFGITLHTHTEVQGQRKVAQHGSKGARDVLQNGRSTNGRGEEGELGTCLLVGEVHIATHEMELGALTLLKLEVFQSQAFFIGRHLTLQLTDVDAGNGVLSRTLTQPAVHRTILDTVNGYLQVSPYIEVSHVEETALGFVGILTRAVVVGLIVDTV